MFDAYPPRELVDHFDEITEDLSGFRAGDVPPRRYECDGLTVGPLGEAGKYRHGRFMVHEVARPWRGLVLDVRTEPLGRLDDDDAVREGVLRWEPERPELRGSLGGAPVAWGLGWSVWSLDGVTWGDSPREAFVAGWLRLHGTWEPDQEVARIEWDPRP